MTTGYHPLWAEINLDAVAHNIRALKGLTPPGTGLMAVVKANAYGHGMVEVARVAVKNGAEWLAVARVDEGIALREAGFKEPVLVFGWVPSVAVAEALEKDLNLTIYDRDSAIYIAEAARVAGRAMPVHVKVDTGMGRLGFSWDEKGIEDIVYASSLEHLEVTGIYTHFAVADAQDKSYTLMQLKRFKEIIKTLSNKGITFNLVHAANSPALIDLPETHFDIVRPGISIYGLYPSDEVDRSRVLLQPVMTLKTRVAQLKRVDTGFSVSYGCTYRTTGTTLLATLAVGYADGFSRLLSSKGQVLIHGKRAPVVGRVCMDQCIVDVGHIDGINPGDEVVIMGKQGGDYIGADEIASAIGTINYEVLTGVSCRVPRVYL